MVCVSAWFRQAVRGRGGTPGRVSLNKGIQAVLSGDAEISNHTTLSITRGTVRTVASAQGWGCTNLGDVSPTEREIDGLTDEEPSGRRIHAEQERWKIHLSPR